MGNYLMSVAGLSAAGSLFLQSETQGAWAWGALAMLAAVLVVRSFAAGVFSARQSVPTRSR